MYDASMDWIQLQFHLETNVYQFLRCEVSYIELFLKCTVFNFFLDFQDQSNQRYDYLK